MGIAGSYASPAPTTGTVPIDDLRRGGSVPPPVLVWLVHGTADPVVDVGHSCELCSALVEQGWPVSLNEVATDHAGVMVIIVGRVDKRRSSGGGRSQRGTCLSAGGVRAADGPHRRPVIPPRTACSARCTVRSGMRVPSATTYVPLWWSTRTTPMLCSWSMRPGRGPEEWHRDRGCAAPMHGRRRALRELPGAPQVAVHLARSTAHWHAAGIRVGPVPAAPCGPRWVSARSRMSSVRPRAALEAGGAPVRSRTGSGLGLDHLHPGVMFSSGLRTCSAGPMSGRGGISKRRRRVLRLPTAFTLGFPGCGGRVGAGPPSGCRPAYG